MMGLHKRVGDKRDFDMVRQSYSLDSIVRVGYDIDGVFADFTKAFTEVAPSISPVSEEETWAGNYATMWGQLKVQEAWNAIHNTPLFYEKNIGVLSESAVEDTKELIKHPQVEPHYVTARDDREKVWRQTRDWLQDKGLRGQLHHDKHKGRAARDLNLDFFIDDRVHNVLNVQRKSMASGYLLDMKYNQSANVKNRVDSVETFNNVVRSYLSNDD